MKTIHGCVTPLPGGGEGHWRVAIVDGEVEYYVLPRGAGIDLNDHLSEQVEVEGTIIESPDGPDGILVRTYRLMDTVDDDSWYEDDEA